MADKTPAEKLRLKPGMSAAFLHLPDGMRESLVVPAGVSEVAPSDADFILAFAANQADAVTHLSEVAPAVREKTITWIAYPKGSKAAGYDISRDTIWKTAEEFGLILNANVAIDDVYSAVRMRLRKPGE